MLLSGKEGNKIIERLTGEVEDPEEYRTDYGYAEHGGIAVAFLLAIARWNAVRGS